MIIIIIIIIIIITTIIPIITIINILMIDNNNNTMTIIITPTTKTIKLTIITITIVTIKTNNKREQVGEKGSDLRGDVREPPAREFQLFVARKEFSLLQYQIFNREFTSTFILSILCSHCRLPFFVLFCYSSLLLCLMLIFSYHKKQ